MPLVRDGQSNLIRIIYTLGAVILLIASLFFVLEWSYAKELFGLGLFMEIIVFVLSLIEPQKSTGKQEIVFKPKKSTKFIPDTPTEAHSNSAQHSLEDSISTLTDLNQQLAKSLQKVELNYQDNLLRTSQLEQRMEKLQLQIRQTNEQLKQILNET